MEGKVCKRRVSFMGEMTTGDGKSSMSNENLTAGIN
jgi:hypothetical protein